MWLDRLSSGSLDTFATRPKRKYIMSTSRKITNIYQADFGVYDLEGPIQKDIRLLNLGYDRETEKGWYAMRMAPGAQTIPHKQSVRRRVSNS